MPSSSPQDTLHQRLFTLDSHVDIPWPTGEDPFGATARCLDIPKMRAGGLDAVCLAAYVPQGPLTTDGWNEANARARSMLATIRLMGQNPAVRIATSADAIEEARAAGVPAIIPVVENGHALAEDLENVARFAALGVRYITLTHNGHNALADSAVPRRDFGDEDERHGGLSDFGRAAIAEMNRTGILVDISHVSAAAARDAIGCSATAVIASHSCARAICDHPRNLADAELDLLAAHGGLVQITAVPFFVRVRGSRRDTHVGHFCDHLDHVARRIGVDHVGIGSDFDGGGGLADWRNVAENANVTAELLRRGYGEEDLAKIWGGNFMRLLRQAEGRVVKPPPPL